VAKAGKASPATWRVTRISALVPAVEVRRSTYGSSDVPLSFMSVIYVHVPVLLSSGIFRWTSTFYIDLSLQSDGFPPIVSPLCALFYPFRFILLPVPHSFTYIPLRNARDPSRLRVAAYPVHSLFCLSSRHDFQLSVFHRVHSVSPSLRSSVPGPITYSNFPITDVIVAWKIRS
jgi:hypothetical protein